MEDRLSSIDVEKGKNEFVKGFSASFSSMRRTVATLTIGAIVLSLTVLSSHPTYSMQMLQSGFLNWPLAVVARFQSLFLTSGTSGILLTTLFSLLVGVTITNTITQLKMNHISKDIFGAIPGFLAAGCASCGVGILSIIGLGGVLASMPFQGNLLRLGGVLILVGLISKTGDPETCSI